MHLATNLHQHIPLTRPVSFRMQTWFWTPGDVPFRYGMRHPTLTLTMPVGRWDSQFSTKQILNSPPPHTHTNTHTHTAEDKGGSERERKTQTVCCDINTHSVFWIPMSALCCYAGNTDGYRVWILAEDTRFS